MIKVVMGNNVLRKEYLLDENITLRAALENNEIDYTGGLLHLDGSCLNPGDLDKTFRELGVQEKCFLLKVAKVDNA